MAIKRNNWRSVTALKSLKEDDDIAASTTMNNLIVFILIMMMEIVILIMMMIMITWLWRSWWSCWWHLPSASQLLPARTVSVRRRTLCGPVKVPIPPHQHSAFFANAANIGRVICFLSGSAMATMTALMLQMRETAVRSFTLIFNLTPLSSLRSGSGTRHPRLPPHQHNRHQNRHHNRHHCHHNHISGVCCWPVAMWGRSLYLGCQQVANAHDAQCSFWIRCHIGCWIENQIRCYIHWQIRCQNRCQNRCRIKWRNA